MSTPDFLQEELLKVESLQQTLRDMIENGDHISTDTQVLIDYTHHFYALMEFQSILWTRLKLLKDPELEGIVLAIEMVCDALAREPNETVEDFHSNMKNECILTLEALTGEDMSDFDGIDVEFKWN